MHQSSFSVEASSLDCWQMSAWAVVVVVLLCSAPVLVAVVVVSVPVTLPPSLDVAAALAVISVSAVAVVAVVVVQLVPSCPRRRHHQGMGWCWASLVVVVAVVLSLARLQTGSLLCQLAGQSCLPRSHHQTDLCSFSPPVLSPVLLLVSLLEQVLVLSSLFVMALEEVSAMVLEVALGAGVVTSSLLMVCLLLSEELPAVVSLVSHPCLHRQ